jgi:hypothetical protein
MLSMPLAHSSTLDHRNHVAQTTVTASYVEEFWSPALLRSTQKPQAKAKALFQLRFPCVSTEEPFSLGRGLILD